MQKLVWGTQFPWKKVQEIGMFVDAHAQGEMAPYWNAGTCQGRKLRFLLMAYTNNISKI